MSMWRELLLLLGLLVIIEIGYRVVDYLIFGLLVGLLVIIEIGYRVVDYLIYKANNIPGEMDSEE